MAVAVKNTSESTARSETIGVAMASLAGAAYVLAGIGVVTQVIPKLWKLGVSPWLASVPFVDAAGLIIVLLFAVGALIVLGLTLVGPNPPRGLRAGIFTVLFWLAMTLFVAMMVGRFFGWITGVDNVGIASMAIAAAGMIFWGWTLLQRRSTPGTFERFETQGWFTSERYKPTQGLRVRRATMLGLLVLLGSGVWVLHNHASLASVEKDWVLTIPFTNIHIPLLPDVEITLPILLAAGAFWVSFRVVNWPMFADFLIATEAEVNKISWASRKSVVQDTIVVLSTVLLLTVFLFGVDLLWGALLGWEKIGILKLKPQQPAASKQADQIDW